MAKHWSPDDDRLLAFLWGHRALPLREIATYLDRDAAAIMGRRAYLGIPPREHPTAQPFDQFVVRADAELGSKARHRASELGLTLSEYIRTLIKKDLWL